MIRAALVSLVLATLTLAPPERRFHVEVGGSRIDVTIAEGTLAAPDSETQAWVETSARAVTAYYGRFPVKNVLLTIHPTRGRRVGSGVTYGGRRPTIDVDLGGDAGRDAFKHDWVLTHEMTHLAFPDMPRRHHWIEEGIATYVEPFARLQIGELTPETVWGDLVRGLPQGLPKEGDEGLDHTATWGRTYWGGALFCFLADVEIRKQTKNGRGLQDALRGILDAGGSLRESWTIDRALAAADKATGVAVLAKLYDAHKATAVKTDLDAIWKDLGVSVVRGKTVFDDSAPSASVRKAIERSRRWL
jgi:hypothetical protein